ncbi:unnamed protein product [Strongylus vulgaris]|uniref:Uncharacterized protein n=1 Tax=Strongylus vulgaris TaxID=40348 RepID=A0A3P7LAV3_STRVU|nr:unnamed protein product [Strongylus vulgaris]
MVWIARHTSAGRIRGGISPVGLTVFDTGAGASPVFVVMLPAERGSREGPYNTSLSPSLCCFQKFRLPVLSKIFLQSCSATGIGYQSLEM